MTTDPLAVILAGLNQVNTVKNTSLINNGGFRQVLNVWRNAEKRLEAKEEEKAQANGYNFGGNVSLGNNVAVYFMEIWEEQKQNDDEFYERWSLVSPQYIQQIWQTLSEYYEFKKTYDPRVKEEIRIKLSKIV